MKNLITAKMAGNLILVLLALLASFHLLVIFGLVPRNIVWGGQFQNGELNIILMEILALAITVLFILIIAIRLEYILKGKIKRLSRIGVWVICGFFLLNTVGNLASSVSFEKYFFAPLAIILSLLSLRLALEK